MESEIVALATSGATTMVNLMATELWTRASGRFAALFGRRAETVAEELEEIRAEVVAMDDSSAAVDEWALRLRRVLADEAVQEQLRDLIAEFAPRTDQQASIQNNVSISGGSFSGVTILAGTIGKANAKQ